MKKQIMFGSRMARLLAFNVFFTLMGMQNHQQDGLFNKISNFANNLLDHYMFKIRLTLSTDPNKNDSEGYCTLHRAVSLENVTIIKTLLADKRINPNVQTRGVKLTPLHCAVISSYVTTVKILLADKRTDLNVQDMRGDTPLHYSLKLYFGTDELTKLLLANNAILPTKANGLPLFNAHLIRDKAMALLLACSDQESFETYLDSERMHAIDALDHKSLRPDLLETKFKRDFNTNVGNLHKKILNRQITGSFKLVKTKPQKKYLELSNISPLIN